MKAFNGYKLCTKCQCVYPVIFFCKDKHTSDNLKNVCRDCNSVSSATSRNTWKNNNLCIRCGKNPVEDKLVCSECIKTIEERRIKNAKSGLCMDCGKNPINFYRSMRLCNECRDRYTKVKREIEIERMSKGLCKSCGEPVNRTTTLCDTCADRKNYNNRLKRSGSPNIERLKLELKEYMEKYE